MGLLPGWLPGAAALLLLGGSSGSSSTKHSYSILWVGVSESGRGLPRFIASVYMDDLLLAIYSKEGNRILPRVPWIEMLEKEDPQLWQKETKDLWAWDLELQWILANVKNVYNHSQGLHTLQVRTGCELNAGGQRRGHYQLGYDGRDFIAFDNKTHGWITADAPARSITKMWATYQSAIPLLRFFLEVECFEWLQKHLRYGKEAVQRRGSGSTNHSYSLLWTGVSESGLGLSWFISLGYLDDVLLGAYSSDGKRIVPRVPWVEKWIKEDTQDWQKTTKIVRTWFFEFQWLLEKVQNVYNHSQGLHILQLRISCELKADGQRVGHFWVAYDQRDIMAFDTETFSWMAVDAAKDIPNLWRAFAVPHVGAFLTVDCFKWLWRHLHSGKEVLQRREPPVVKVMHKKSHDGLETFLCQAHGFYPKEIEATWRKDGEGRQGNMSHGVVSPNADGTYYAWISIEIDPKERSHYQCHVEHDGLQDPLDVAVEESALVPLGLIVGIALMSGILLLIGIVLYIRVGKGPFVLKGVSSCMPHFLGC